MRKNKRSKNKSNQEFKYFWVDIQRVVEEITYQESMQEIDLLLKEWAHWLQNDSARDFYPRLAQCRIFAAAVGSSRHSSFRGMPCDVFEIREDVCMRLDFLIAKLPKRRREVVFLEYVYMKGRTQEEKGARANPAMNKCNYNQYLFYAKKQLLEYLTM